LLHLTLNKVLKLNQKDQVLKLWMCYFFQKRICVDLKWIKITDSA